MHERRRLLRERLPHDRSGVLLEVIGTRIHHLLRRRSTILEETLRFWNRVVADAALQKAGEPETVQAETATGGTAAGRNENPSGRKRKGK